MSGLNLASYRVDIFSPEVVEAQEGSAFTWEMSDQRLLANLPAMMESMEEDLQNLLPDGYSVRITPWKETP